MYGTPWTQDVNWTDIRRWEDVEDVFWTSYVRSIYVLCLEGEKEKCFDAMKVFQRNCYGFHKNENFHKMEYIVNHTTATLNQSIS